MGEYSRCERKCLEYFRSLLLGRNRFKGVKRTKKINILLAIILVVCARLFFSALLADFFAPEPTHAQAISDHEILDPMSKIKDFKDKEKKEDKKRTEKICPDDKLEKPDGNVLKKEDRNQQKYMELVENYPMAEMVPYISERDKKTAAFLVSIAKEESDWGKHSPSKGSKHCYNYWGYKGGYDPTESGYSCFDSAQQAIQVVGDRIDQLVEKKLDTPQKIVVWKCGSNCAQDNQAGNWIAAVSSYFHKLDS